MYQFYIDEIISLRFWEMGFIQIRVEFFAYSIYLNTVSDGTLHV